MKHVLLVVALLAGVPACLPASYLPASPPHMTTIQLPETPDAAYLHARQAVAAMGGRILNHDATVRVAFAQVPGTVVLHVAVIPDQSGAAVLVTGHVMSDHPLGDAGRELRAYVALLRRAAVRE
jgi:hypothetical protein